MSNSIKDIRTAALALSVSERACLAYDLILSLDDPEDLELPPEEEAEIQRRIQLVREGKAFGRSAESVISDIHTEYNK